MLSFSQRIGILFTSLILSTQRMAAMSAMASTPCKVRYLNQAEATEVDVKLMGSVDKGGHSFTLEQLMELAGLSVAEALHESRMVAADEQGRHRVLIVSGPGNNGGDGLVAARHAALFGYDVDVVYPRHSRNEFLVKLVEQLGSFGVRLLDEMPTADQIDSDYGGVVDAVFGFSFRAEGGIRAPYDRAIKAMRECNTPVLSVDVPSGQHVERGNESGEAVVPAVLVSLTAPKLCARFHKGLHFVGGRFVPPAMSQELCLPKYPGTSQVVRIDRDDQQVIKCDI